MSRQRSTWKLVDRYDQSQLAVEAIRQAGAAGVEMFWRNVHDGQLRAIVALEPAGWHLSVSHARWERKGRPVPGRYPTWDELADARYALMPTDIDVVMHLPPPDEYVSVHDTTFHLHEHPPLDQVEAIKKDLVTGGFEQVSA